MRQILTKLRIGDMLLLYLYDTNNDRIGLSMVPESFENKITLEGDLSIEPLVHLKLVGDPYLGGGTKSTVIHDIAKELTFREQYVEHDKDTNTIVTVLENKKVIAFHKLLYHEDANAIIIITEIENRFINPITIEMVSNFSICGWPMIESGSADSSRYGVQSLQCKKVVESKMNQSLPIEVVKDLKHGICIGAMVDYDEPWRIDIYNYENRFAIVGGLRGNNKVNMNKILKNKEVYVTPATIISVVDGDEGAIRDRFAKEIQYLENEKQSIPLVKSID